MPWLAPIIGGIASLGSGIAGSLSSASARDDARSMAQQALKQILDSGVPPDESLPIVFQQFQQAGMLTPELEDAILQTHTAMTGVQTDPQLRTAQLNALQMIGDRSRLGFGPEERAAFNKVQQEVGRNAEAKRQQIIQNMQARGMGGSGTELAAALSASQAQDELASEQGDRLAASAAQNALQAMSQYGQLGGQIRQQDFGEQSDRARAQDEMNRFNVVSQQGVQQRNVASQNAAQASNIGRQQATADRNVGLSNQELYRQSQARQQNYYDRLAKAQAAANALNQQGSNLNQQAQQTAQNWTNIGSGVAGAAQEVNKAVFPSMYKKEDEDKKK